MSETEIRQRPDNDEATEAWNGPLFDRWVGFRDLIVSGVAPHGRAAMRAHPPATGDRVLDIGCGLGDTSGDLAELVGPQGSVRGVDVAQRMIETAEAERRHPNVSFTSLDVQYTPFEDTYDYAFSRFGTMFFANPVQALRNVRASLVPGGLLNMVVWRQKPDNDWLYRAELVAKRYLDEPEETDEPTCGPGPFSMAGADVVSGILVSSGFERITLERCDIPIKIGNDVEQAIALVTGLGPAGEVIRLAGEEGDDIRPTIEAELREALGEFTQPDGTIAGSASTWLISARNPAAG